MSDQNSMQRLTNLKTEIDRIRRRKIEIQAEMKNLESEKKTLLEECQKLNINSKDIDSEVTKQEQDIKNKIADVMSELRNLNAI